MVPSPLPMIGQGREEEKAITTEIGTSLLQMANINFGKRGMNMHRSPGTYLVKYTQCGRCTHGKDFDTIAGLSTSENGEIFNDAIKTRQAPITMPYTLYCTSIF
ncbi:hypothetical protein TNCT_630571 [Trichonephila clavata]|uniref:Uncharacterized protein n=1 Tax=Trichonephila clavata TaxID=2740835 RepID=A0A8X6IYC6_TRICU|nr:hypothetical protein TNCT_630571 [Trichonephila clavata]